MGRKKLLKPCSQCRESLERGEFFRSDWEKEDGIRLCRRCAQEEKSKANTALLNSDSVPVAPALDDLGMLDDFFFDDVVGDLSLPADFDATCKEQARCLQAKRRRVRLNMLFTSLSEEMDLPSQADRVNILETSLGLIRSLKAEKKLKCVEEEKPTGAAVVSILDVVRRAEEDLKEVTLSELA